MLTEFQKKKLNKVFQNHDFDSNGVLEKADFEGLVTNLCQFRNYHKESSEYKNLESNYMKIWSELQKVADANSDNKITLDEWFTCFDSILATEDSYNQVIGPIINLLFNIADVDGKGQINQEEFKVWAQNWNLSESEASESFLKIDGNGDGILDKQEFKQLYYELFCSDDPSAFGNWVAGALS